MEPGEFKLCQAPVVGLPATHVVERIVYDQTSRNEHVHARILDCSGSKAILAACQLSQNLRQRRGGRTDLITMTPQRLQVGGSGWDPDIMAK